MAILLRGGKIKEMDEIRTIVIYGDDAPIWDSNLWWNKNIKVFDTEREARNVVDVYKTADSYYYRHDPR